MKIRQLLSDPIFHLCVAAVVLVLPAAIEIAFGVDLEAWIGSNVDVATLIVLSIAFPAILISSIYKYVKLRIRPKEFLCEEARYIYSINDRGDFEGNFIILLNNGSRRTHNKFPTETFLWNDGLSEENVYFKFIYRDGDRPHRFSDKKYHVDKRDLLIDRVRGKTPYALTWSPEIMPPIDPGETVLYEILVQTPATEMAAFSDEGTTLGFPVTLHTRKVSLVVKAPFGYGFEFVEPSVEVIRVSDGSLLFGEEKKISKPEVSADKSLLEWEIRNPDRGRRYWVNYRLKKKKYD